MKIEVGKTYNVKVWDDQSIEYWEFEFTPEEFLTTGAYAGAFKGRDEDGWPCIVETDEFISEVE
jgi:hypothetical protein